MSTASAAIIAGTDNQDGTWTVGGRTVSLQTSTVLFGFATEDQVSFDDNVRVSLGGGTIAFRRDSDLSLNGRQNLNTLPIYSSFASGFGAGAQAGSDNFLLLSLEPRESNWDTVVQFNFDSSSGIITDSILGIWHDDSASGENIIANISSFSELAALVVPEPSSVLFLGLGVFGFVIRRCRTRLT